MSEHHCPCGARLWTRDELLATGDGMDRHVAQVYLTEADGFCADEDDVVPLGYAAEVIRRRTEGAPVCDCDPTFGCDACCVPLDFPPGGETPVTARTLAIVVAMIAAGVAMSLLLGAIVEATR